MLLLSSFVLTNLSQAATLSYQKNCQMVKQLNIQVQLYQCPDQDKSLATNLNRLIGNKKLLNKICASSFNRHECLTGDFSLAGESAGLANIANAPTESECEMAIEDKAQETWYLSGYTVKQCFFT